MSIYLCDKISQNRDLARVLVDWQHAGGCYTDTVITVIWCIGHLLGTAPPEVYGEQYRQWFIKPLPIILERWRSDIKALTKAQFTAARLLIHQATERAIAKYANRKGKMIAREIIEDCDYRGTIRRLWLFALSDAYISKALNTLKPRTEILPQYPSALACSHVIWLIGMPLSQLSTYSGYHSMLFVGHVQTPTQDRVVNGAREIERIIALLYWVAGVSLSQANQNLTPPEHSTAQVNRCLQQSIT